MLHKLAKASVVLALSISLGAQWAFLQSIAWTGMLYNYTKEAGFARGVAMTFDGEHPCPLCMAIEQGKAQERKQQKETVQPCTELKLDLPPVRFVFVHPPHAVPPGFIVNPVGLRAQQPEPPPPRLS